MKFLIPLTLLVAAGVSAQDQECQADYIVTRCLNDETKKAEACKPNDWDCLCAAYQAVATCYNNCPNDARAPSARHQVTTYCQEASLYGTKAHASKTASAASRSSSSAAFTTTESASLTDATSTAASSTSRPTSTSTGAAAALPANAGRLLVAVAGAAAALL